MSWNPHLAKTPTEFSSRFEARPVCSLEYFDLNARISMGGTLRSWPVLVSTSRWWWQVYKDVDLRGVGDLLAKSTLARGYAKCMYSCLSEQTLRPGRFDDQRAECLKAKASR